MGFMEMSCREPEEVSYGSEEQKGNLLLESTNTSAKGEQTVTSSLSFCLLFSPALSYTHHLLCLRLTLWDYVKHQSSVSANEAVDEHNRSQRLLWLLRLWHRISVIDERI